MSFYLMPAFTQNPERFVGLNLPTTNGQDQQYSFPPVIDGNTISRANIILPEPIVTGILSLTEKLELAGGSKSFKTWSLIDMGLSVSNGAAWWGHQTFPTHIVYLNMELSKPFFEQRLVDVAEARKLPIPSAFHVVHLRGAKLHEPLRWEAFLKYLESLLDRFPQPLVISDPIYKMLGGKSENSAGDINVMMDQLEDLIQRTHGANAFGHHFTKGNQSDKEAIDRASGSGVFQRDPDTLLAMTKHETDNCFTVESILRNHCPLADFVLEWHYPLFVPRRDLDPQDLKKPRGREPRYKPEDLLAVLGNQFLLTNAFEKRARREIGVTRSTFFVLLKKAEKTGLISKSSTTEEWETVQK
jgi:AAA domain